MRFAAAVVTSTCAVPVYMVLLNVLYFLLFCSVSSSVFAQGVGLNVSKFCKKCVH